MGSPRLQAPHIPSIYQTSVASATKCDFKWLPHCYNGHAKARSYRFRRAPDIARNLVQVHYECVEKIRRSDNYLAGKFTTYIFTYEMLPQVHEYFIDCTF